MINGNERRAFYHILFPNRGKEGGMAARVPDVNETRLNDNFKIIGDEFRKIWEFIKNGFSTKGITASGDVSIGGGLDVTGDASVGGDLSATGDITSNGKSVVLKTYVDATASNYTIGSGNYVAVPYPPGLNGRNVVSIGLVTWTNNSGPFSFFPYGETNASWYIIGASGTTINGAKFRYWYI